MNRPNAATSFRHAQEHLKRVLVAREDPTDWADLTIYGFYCLESAVMAAATHTGIAVPPVHSAKAAAARGLAQKEGLPDVSALLGTLNTARKAVAYGDTLLPALDPDDLATAIEGYVQAVAELLQR